MGNNDSGWNDWSLQKELGEIPQQLVGKKKVLSSRKVDIDPNTFRYPRPTVSQENRNLIQKDHSSVLSARDYFFKEKHSEVVTPKVASPKPLPEIPLPKLPPKPEEYMHLDQNVVPSTHDDHYDTFTSENTVPETEKDQVVVDEKPTSYVLRKLYVPDNLCNVFLEYAEKNTKSNLETCGILLGVI
ncbi:hypothetical protein BB560_004409, partial [Smittium megazygosporum]